MSKVKAISLLMRCILSPSPVELRLSRLVAGASDAADGDLRISHELESLSRLALLYSSIIYLPLSTWE